MTEHLEEAKHWLEWAGEIRAVAAEIKRDKAPQQRLLALAEELERRAVHAALHDRDGKRKYGAEVPEEQRALQQRNRLRKWFAARK